MSIAIHQLGSTDDHANPARIFVGTLRQEDNVSLLARWRLGKCLQLVPRLTGLRRRSPTHRKRQKNQN